MRKPSMMPTAHQLKQRRKAESHVPRLYFLQFGMYGAFVLILIRLFYWQIIKGDELQALAESQYTSVTNWQGKRGKIYTADGQLLVGNQTVYTLFAQPQF